MEKPAFSNLNDKNNDLGIMRSDLQGMKIYSPINQTFEVLFRNLKATARDIDFKAVSDKYGIYGSQKTEALKALSTFRTLYYACDYIHTEFNLNLSDHLREDYVAFVNSLQFDLEEVSEAIALVEDNLIEAYEACYEPSAWSEAEEECSFIWDEEESFNKDLGGKSSDVGSK